MKKLIITSVLMLATAGCGGKEIPVEAQYCAGIVSVWLGDFHQNFEVTAIDASVLAQNIVIVTGHDQKDGKIAISAKCEIYKGGGQMGVNKWWLSAIGSGLNWQDHEMIVSREEELLIRKGMPVVNGISFKAKGYEEKAYGAVWF